MLVSWLPLRLLATESALDLQNGDTSTVYIYEVIRGDQRETIGQPGSLDAVYRTLNRLSDGLQAPSAEGGLNGELTQGSMVTVIQALEEQGHMGPSSHFLDCGSGQGKPTLSVAHLVDVQTAMGIEIGALRYGLGMNAWGRLLEQTSLYNNVIFIEADVMSFETFQPATHVYSFDKVFPPTVLASMIRSLQASPSVQYFVSYQTLRTWTGAWQGDPSDFPLEPRLVGQLNQLKMHGSSECHTAYIYRLKSTKMRTPTEDERISSGRQRTHLHRGDLQHWAQTEYDRTMQHARRTEPVRQPGIPAETMQLLRRAIPEIQISKGGTQVRDPTKTSGWSAIRKESDAKSYIQKMQKRPIRKGFQARGANRGEHRDEDGPDQHREQGAPTSTTDADAAGAAHITTAGDEPDGKRLRGG